MKHFIDIDNATLIDECKVGDREAMSLLYTRFAPRMLHVISRYVSNKEDAHDILHDGFIAAFTRLDSLRDPERVDYWLATIMKNLSLKFLQAQNVASILDDIPDEIEEDSDLEDIIDFTTLEALIMQLPEGYRKVFRLAVLENKSHKEISKILGIAPNSSSSQLFHAKVMLRRLITEHRKKVAMMTLLLLIAVSAGLLWLPPSEFKDNTGQSLLSDSHTTEKTVPGHAGTTGKTNDCSGTEDEETPEIRTSGASENAPAVSTSDAPTDISPQETEETDRPVEPVVIRPSDLANSYKDRVAESSSDEEAMVETGVPLRKPDEGKKWSAGISFDSGMLSFSGLESSLDNNYDPGHDPSRPEDPPQSPSDEGEDNALNPTRAADYELPDDMGNWSHRHHLPVTFGFTVERHFTSWAGVETGIGYTYLRSDYESRNMEVKCHWHYLDLPLKVNLYAYNSDNFSIYGSFGGRLSIPVYSDANVQCKGESTSYKVGSLDSNPVWSAGVSIGVSYSLSKRLNIFLEPSLQYHFPRQSKVPNIWTDDEPWSFSIPVGIRFSW